MKKPKVPLSVPLSDGLAHSVASPIASQEAYHRRDAHHGATELAEQQATLDELVLARTRELAEANARLQQEIAERKRIEAQGYYHTTLLHNLSDAIIATDIQSRITAWNVAAEAMYGWRAEEALGMLVTDVLKCEYIDYSLQQVIGQLVQEGIWRGEVIQYHQCGKPLYIMTSVALVRDAYGNPIGSVAVNRDVTDQHATEERLNVLSRSIEQSPISIMITDTNGAIEYVNPKFTKLTGYTLDEVKGRNPRILKSDNSSRADYKRLWETILDGKEWQGELHNRGKDGSLFWESAAISPVFNTAGKITHFIALKEDITERKRRESEQQALLKLVMVLREANEREEMIASALEQCAEIVDASIAAFGSYIEDSGDVLVEMALQHDKSIHNVAIRVQNTQGISTSVIQSGRPYWSDNILEDPRFLLTQLVADERAMGCLPLIVQNQRLGVIWVIRKTPFTPDEQRLATAVADMTAVALHRASLDARLLRYTTDLEREVEARTHELAAANERLQELDRLKSKFVSDVTHELRSPVGNIGLYLTLLERKPEKQAEYLAILRQQVELLQKLVKETLDLSRIDQHREKLSLAPVDLNEITRAIVAAHAARAEKQNLILHFDADPTLPSIMGDGDKLARVIINLVANALNYTPNGQVLVRTYREPAEQTGPGNSAENYGGMVACEVRDTGCGIYADDLPHLFERFYRGTRDHMPPVAGTGLGLSIVKELIELHGGTVSVTSEVGVGSTFTVKLPFSHPAQPR